MRKKFFLLKFVLLLFTYVNVSAQDLHPSATISPKQARMLATDQLPKVLQWMEPEDLSLYGFSAADDFQKITVGRPFYFASMEDAIESSRKGKGALVIKSMMLPLILENKARCFIFLSYEDNEWKAVGIGSKEYAAKGGSIFNKSDDNPSIIITLPQLHEEYVEDNSKGLSTYRPIFRSNKSMEKESFTLNELISLFNQSAENIN